MDVEISDEIVESSQYLVHVGAAFTQTGHKDTPVSALYRVVRHVYTNYISIFVMILIL